MSINVMLVDDSGAMRRVIKEIIAISGYKMNLCIEAINEMLMAATFEVFEKMFYIFSEPLHTESGDYHTKSSIHFIGPASGEVQLLLSRGVAEAMAKNMLGLDRREITHTILADCVKECTNMICGNFVRRLDPEKPFRDSITMAPMR